MTSLQEQLETPSGKGSADENFPVASRLIARPLRRHVHLFYAFARAADDIADNPELEAEDKIARLDLFAESLVNPRAASGAPSSALALARSLSETGVPARHPLDLLDAFRQDATTLRYETWDDLLDYCNRSAAPVGRYLIDLHGEAASAYEASDNLCNALQVLNHLQDCKADRARLDRVYLPLTWFREAGTGVEALDGTRSTAAMRHVLDRCLAATGGLLERAAPLPDRIRGLRFSMECAVIVSIAGRLRSELERRDPLAERVVLSRSQYAGSFARQLPSLLRRGLTRRR
ncbi:MAG: squalene synthase HpnC [bacterium]|nr:squalene synthase HpnC [bacterium]MDE0418188.1 squalene synthase HpnC [bacterium]